jgi:hypothetical protein
MAAIRRPAVRRFVMGMQSRRALIRAGFAILLLAAAVIMREWTFILILFAAFGCCLILLGHKPEWIKGNIKHIAPPLLKGVDYLEKLLVPRDEQQEAHYRALIATYTPELRNALRTLKNTRNASLIHDFHWQQFERDGLVDHLFSGPGEIKEHLRDTVGRALDEVGDR